MRAISLHRDVLVVTSALLQVNCVIVRGGGEQASGGGQTPAGPIGVIVPGGGPGELADTLGEQPQTGPIEVIAPSGPGECFVIDSPVLPDELDALGSLIERAAFPAPSALLCTHGDWDHVLGRLAFPGLALGCAQSTAERFAAAPGAAQRELRTFDEDLGIVRAAPLALGSVQALPVPGRCELGARELELHATGGHTADGLAVVIGWAGVLVAGDYLSPIEIPSFGYGGSIERYEQTLAELGALLEHVEHVVPGHGPAIEAAHARMLLQEDLAYLRALRELRGEAPLPDGRRGARQRELHAENVALLASAG